MRRFLLFASLPVVLLLLSMGAARADTLSISADVPVVYTFNDSNLHDASASGVIVGVSLPFLVGFGGEAYKVTAKAGPGLPTDDDIEYKVQMFDVFLDLPFPVANLRVGGGLGKGDLSVPSSPATQFGSANLAQLFFNVGIPFAGVFDVHVGYHSISGDAEETSASPPVKQKVGAKMGTIGLKVGF